MFCLIYSVKFMRAEICGKCSSMFSVTDYPCGMYGLVDKAFTNDRNKMKLSMRGSYALVNQFLMVIVGRVTCGDE